MKKAIIIIVIAVALAIGGYFLFRGKKAASQDFTAAKRADLVQEVSVTGRVKPAKSVDLSFEKNGGVEKIYAGVGAHVAAGQVLVELDSSELAAQFKKANADFAASEADLEKARITLANYYASAPDTLNDAYTKANSAVRNDIDSIFSDDEKNPQLTFGTSNTQIEIDLEFARLKATKNLNDWLGELRGIDGASPERLEGLLALAKTRLASARMMLDLATSAILDSANLSSATALAYQTSVNTARASVDTALSSVNSQEQNIASQKSTISLKEAAAKSADANAANIQAQLEKLSLRSPIAGVVTKQEAEVGETAKANEVLVTIISAGNLEIEANIPEADISKVKKGNSAKVTLDAYGNDVFFKATVVSIDPAETIIEGVPTYKTTLLFIAEDARVKPGMTANIDIATAARDGVIVVPQRAVITRDGAKFVLVDAGRKEPEERRVEVGLRGSDGNIEIVSGLNEGEKVATFGGL